MLCIKWFTEAEVESVRTPAATQKTRVMNNSSDILFFKIEYDPDTDERLWQQYHVEHVRGFIYYIKGNIRI